MTSQPQPPQHPLIDPEKPERGIIKQWNSERKFGIIYAPEGKRYFLHPSKVVDGTPELYRRVTFAVAPARRPEELPQAVNVKIGEKVGVQS